MPSHPHDHLSVFTAMGIWLGLMLASTQVPAAQQNSVTAIDIALEPDATMVQHAMAANARLLKSFPKGFTLDATHHSHAAARRSAENAAIRPGRQVLAVRR